LTHTHASARFGVINLGLGPLVDRDTLAAHIRHLLRSEELRRTLHVRALHETADRSNAAIIRRCMHLIGWYLRLSQRLPRPGHPRYRPIPRLTCSVARNRCISGNVSRITCTLHSTAAPRVSK